MGLRIEMRKYLSVPPTLDTAGFPQVDLWDEIRYQLPLPHQCGGDIIIGPHRTILHLGNTKRIGLPDKVAAWWIISDPDARRWVIQSRLTALSPSLMLNK